MNLALTWHRNHYTNVTYAPTLMLLLSLMAPSGGYAQTVLPRNAAAISATYPALPVNETAIAAGT